MDQLPERNENSRELWFLDIETSGLDPNYHEPIEVAYINQQGRFEEFSLPFDEGKADDTALEVNGWGKRKFARQLSHEAACALMASTLEGAIIVSNNVAFDVSFLEAFMRRNHFDPPWHYSNIDLKSLVAGRLGVSPLQVSTSSIIKHTGVTNPSAHTALGDAEWNLNVYNKLKLWEG